MKPIGISLTVLCAALCASPAAASEAYHVVWDDFQGGWSANAPGARWLNFTVGSFVADDGIVSTGCHGLSVVSSGVNPLTQEPAFVKSMSQDDGDLSTFDRVKWLAVMNHVSSRGFLGFDAEPGQELACEARLSGQVFGADQHPFGDAVLDPDSDPRLGTVVASAFDPETYLIFNFLVTNDAIYAFYERAPFLRATLGDYASFLYSVPVLPRFRYDEHDLKIAYDRSRGVVRWLVDGAEVFRVATLGSRIDRRFMLVDRGGDDVSVAPAQLDCAMGMFDFLDGYGPTRRGLVQIDADADTYFNPRKGDPALESFVDPTGALKDRLFGQGAAMQVSRTVVSSHPAP